MTDPNGLQAGQDKDVIRVETQLSKKAPSITDVRVTLPNGKPIREDLYVGDKFTITYTARVNRADDGQDLTKIGRIEGVDYSRNTAFKDGKPIGETTVDREGSDSFSDIEGAKAVTDQVIDKVGQKNDETEVTFSQTFEITGRKDGSPGGSNAINFQIVVTDPRAPLTENRNDTAAKKADTPANPAIFTTRDNDPRIDVKSDSSKQVGYRNTRRREREHD
ncbi:MAG: hypothetical protein ACK4S4_13435 [Pyrinomonadaceae bacterium]